MKAKTKCPHKDPFCPCQDGDPCNYDDGALDPKEIIPAIRAWRDDLRTAYICFGPGKMAVPFLRTGSTRFTPACRAHEAG